MEELVQLVFKTYGIVGVILFAPTIAMGFLWKHNQKQQEQNALLNEKIAQIHDKRVEDAKQVAEKLMGMVQEHAELSKETNMALEKVGDMLSILQHSAIQLRRPPKRTEEG